MKGLIYGITGGFFSFFMLIVLQSLLKARDAQGFIAIAVIILSIIICSCTGILVDTYEKKKKELNS